ncbi:hypothetical protein J4474_04820 [Candidatus Pacearchaeota archaeon]|nr:hypothetical protein [Candidatus Pacearchaeota archaeon]
MVKRKKRLKKGIDSLEEQIELHKEKLEKSKEDGNIELEGYYQKEINSLENVKRRKENQLNK